MSHKPIHIHGGTLYRTVTGTCYKGADGSHILFRGVRCHVSRWLVRPLTAYQFCGHIVIGWRWAKRDFNLRFLAHEYGHYLQQREMGTWRFLLRVALPSVWSVLRDSNRHFHQDFERDATQKGKEYLASELRQGS